jgi:hypothetical protein
VSEANHHDKSTALTPAFAGVTTVQNYFKGNNQHTLAIQPKSLDGN